MSYKPPCARMRLIDNQAGIDLETAARKVEIVPEPIVEPEPVPVSVKPVKPVKPVFPGIPEPIPEPITQAWIDMAARKDSTGVQFVQIKETDTGEELEVVASTVIEPEVEPEPEVPAKPAPQVDKKKSHKKGKK